jgi:hypothetical protein
VDWNKEICLFDASRRRKGVLTGPHRLQVAKPMPVAPLGVMGLASLAPGADPFRSGIPFLSIGPS